MRSLLLVLALAGLATAKPAPPTPDSVAVLFNSSLEESAELAHYYAKVRGIPAGNLIGLPLPEAEMITREQYESGLRDPLRQEFKKRRWWQIGSDSEGRRIPVRNKIRVLVSVRGVPLKIKRVPGPPKPKPEPGEKPPKKTPEDMLKEMNEASVDSELCLVGVHDLPSAGSIPNQYHRSEKPIVDANLPFLMLVGRIDAASDATCRRMIDDAVSAEYNGLWGRAYIDIANKYPDGDKWLEGVARSCTKAGIPTIIDRFNDTLPSHYPMTDAALYFGWYTFHVNGPFLDPEFRFRRGAVAMHLHSFSAAQLRDTTKHWCAPLLDRGAAATLGNVHEPFLGLTHELDTFIDRLLAGHTLVEAAYMAARGLSWQNIVLGDPLYRPFLHLDGSGNFQEDDREYRALRVASMRWGDLPGQYQKNISDAAAKRDSGTFYEALGLMALTRKQDAIASGFFDQARTAFTDPRDRLRQEFHLVAIDRSAKRKEAAISRLKAMKFRTDALPQGNAVTGWLNILDPPPPPPVDQKPKQDTPQPTKQ